MPQSKIGLVLKGSSATVAAAGAVVLLGWLLDIPALKSLLPGLVTMKVNTALCFILSGAALAGRGDWPRAGRWAWSGRLVSICAGLTALVGLITLGEYFLGWDPGLDQLVWPDDPQPVLTYSPGRMSWVTALNFSLLGLALALPDRGPAWRWAHVFTLAAAWFSILTLVGYLFGVPEFFVFNFSTSVALNTVLCFLVLCAGAMCAWPGRGIMALLANPGAGGIMARRLLPAAFLVPIALCWLVLGGERAGLFPHLTDLSLLAVASALVVGLLVWLNAHKLGVADNERQQAEEELRKHRDHLEELVGQRTAQLEEQNLWLNSEIKKRQEVEQNLARLAAIVANSDDSIISMDTSGIITSWNRGAQRLYGYTEEEALGRHLSLLVPQGHLDQGMDFLQTALAGERVEQYETVRRSKDGRLLDLSITLSPLLDESGRVVGVSGIARDISRRKQAEDALRASQREAAFLADLLERSSQPFAVGYADGRLGRYNLAFRELVGYSEDELASLDWSRDLTPPAWREAEAGQLARVTAGGQAVRYEKEYRRKDGSLVPVELLVGLEPGDEGQPPYYYGFITDISRRKQAEQALAAERQRLYQVFDLLPGFVYLQAPDYTIRFANRRFRELFGDYEGRFCYEVSAGRSQPCENCPTFQVMLSGQPRVWEWSGKGRVFEIYDFPFRDSDSSDLVLAVAVDITERKQAEQALRQSESLLRETQGITKVGGWEYDVAAQRITWTDEVYRIYGLGREYDPNDIQRDIQFYAPADQEVLARAFSRAVEEGEPYDLELGFTTAQGQRLWVRTTAQAEQQAGKVVRVFGNFMDVTERKQAEDRLKASLAEKEVLLKEIHHRVKNNLAVVSGLLRLQARGLDNPLLREALTDSEGRVRAMALVHETLYQSGTMASIDLGAFLGKLARALQQTYAYTIGGGPLSLEVRAPGVEVELDQATPLGLAVNELLTNSLKYAFPPGRGGKIIITGQDLGAGRMELLVADDGVGMPPGLDWRRTHTLGLGLVRDLVEKQLAGSIELEPGPGTRFLLRFQAKRQRGI